MIPVSHFVILATLLFVIGASGFLFRRNAIVVFMCVELMLNAVNILFIAFSRMHGNLVGEMAVFFVMAVAAAEAAVGLAIIIAFFRTRTSVDTDDAASMHG